jgi:hypothetical protein
MVTDAVPVELSVTVLVVGVFRLTLPNATLVAPRPRAGVAAFSCSAYVVETPPALAVRVAVCAALTAVDVAVKVALEAPAAMVTEAGTVTALLLLVRLTIVPTATGPVIVTLHASATAPVSDPPLQETPLSDGGACPVPLNAIVGVLDALLLISTVPVTAPETAGSKPMVSTAVCPGFSVIGALIPDTENPGPEAVALLRISSAVPADVSVTDLPIAVFSASVPNATLVALTLTAAAAAFSCNP